MLTAEVRRLSPAVGILEEEEKKKESSGTRVLSNKNLEDLKENRSSLSCDHKEECPLGCANYHLVQECACGLKEGWVNNHQLVKKGKRRVGEAHEASSSASSGSPQDVTTGTRNSVPDSALPSDLFSSPPDGQPRHRVVVTPPTSTPPRCPPGSSDPVLQPRQRATSAGHVRGPRQRALESCLVVLQQLRRVVVPCGALLLPVLVSYLLLQTPPGQLTGFMKSLVPVDNTRSVDVRAFLKSPEYGTMLTDFARAQHVCESVANITESFAFKSRQEGRQLSDQLSLFRLGTLSDDAMNKAQAVFTGIRELGRQYSAHSDSVVGVLLKEKTVFDTISDEMPALMVALSEERWEEAIEILQTIRKQLQRVEDAVQAAVDEHRRLQERTIAAQDKVVQLGAVMKAEGMAIADWDMEHGRKQTEEALVALDKVEDLGVGLEQVMRELMHRGFLFSRMKGSLEAAIEGLTNMSVHCPEGGDNHTQTRNNSSPERIQTACAHGGCRGSSRPWCGAFRLLQRTTVASLKTECGLARGAKVEKSD